MILKGNLFLILCIKTEGGNVRMITLQLYNLLLQISWSKKQKTKKLSESHQYALNIKFKKGREGGREGGRKTTKKRKTEISQFSQKVTLFQKLPCTSEQRKVLISLWSPQLASWIPKLYHVYFSMIFLEHNVFTVSWNSISVYTQKV